MFREDRDFHQDDDSHVNVIASGRRGMFLSKSITSSQIVVWSVITSKSKDLYSDDDVLHLIVGPSGSDYHFSEKHLEHKKAALYFPQPTRH